MDQPTYLVLTNEDVIAINASINLQPEEDWIASELEIEKRFCSWIRFDTNIELGDIPF